MTDDRKQFLLEQRRKLQKDAPYVFNMFAAKKLHDNGIIKEIKGSALPLLSNTHSIGSESNKSLTVAAQLD